MDQLKDLVTSHADWLMESVRELAAEHGFQVIRMLGDSLSMPLWSRLIRYFSSGRNNVERVVAGWKHLLLPMIRFRSLPLR